MANTKIKTDELEKLKNPYNTHSLDIYKNIPSTNKTTTANKPNINAVGVGAILGSNVVSSINKSMNDIGVPNLGQSFLNAVMNTESDLANYNKKLISNPVTLVADNNLNPTTTTSTTSTTKGKQNLPSLQNPTTSTSTGKYDMVDLQDGVPYNAMSEKTDPLQRPSTPAVTKTDSGSGGGNQEPPKVTDDENQTNRTYVDNVDYPSQNVVAAQQWIQSQLDNYKSQYSDNISSLIAQLQSGRTSYSDYVDKYLNDLANREAFSYDANSDAMYQNYLAQMQNLGAKAMKDTMGQAAALTGGYGSSYATAAANGAYNDYINTANQAIPDYYNMAFNQYQAEGEAMQDMLNNYINRDESEYNRQLQQLDNLLALDNKEYQQWVDDWKRNYQLNRDAISDARYDREYKDNRSDTLWSQEYQTTQANRTQANADRNYYASLGLYSDGETPLPQTSTTSSKGTATGPQMNTYNTEARSAWQSGGDKALGDYIEKLHSIGLSDDEVDRIYQYAVQGQSPFTLTDRSGWWVFDNKGNNKWSFEVPTNEVDKDGNVIMKTETMTLDELLKNKLITQEEYDEMKNKKQGETYTRK